MTCGCTCATGRAHTSSSAAADKRSPHRPALPPRQLAAWFSRQRGNTGVAVVIAPRHFVTRMAGGRPGQVHFRNEETISVPAELPPESEQWLVEREQ